ncbi:hypothetical protein BC832DRAFT_593907 [Gaertneriomyces semiglobifer]|nr:hypothetical protein BC832DRAFT_593907 [Gaertneriomyces semiglobifer]
MLAVAAEPQSTGKGSSIPTPVTTTATSTNRKSVNGDGSEKSPKNRDSLEGRKPVTSVSDVGAAKILTMDVDKVEAVFSKLTPTRLRQPALRTPIVGTSNTSTPKTPTHNVNVSHPYSNSSHSHRQQQQQQQQTQYTQQQYTPQNTKVKSPLAERPPWNDDFAVDRKDFSKKKEKEKENDRDRDRGRSVRGRMSLGNLRKGYEVETPIRGSSSNSSGRRERNGVSGANESGKEKSQVGMVTPTKGRVVAPTKVGSGSRPGAASTSGTEVEKAVSEGGEKTVSGVADKRESGVSDKDLAVLVASQSAELEKLKTQLAQERTSQAEILKAWEVEYERALAFEKRVEESEGQLTELVHANGTLKEEVKGLKTQMERLRGDMEKVDVERQRMWREMCEIRRERDELLALLGKRDDLDSDEDL